MNHDCFFFNRHGTHVDDNDDDDDDIDDDDSAFDVAIQLDVKSIKRLGYLKEN